MGHWSLMDNADLGSELSPLRNAGVIIATSSALQKEHITGSVVTSHNTNGPKIRHLFAACGANRR